MVNSAAKESRPYQMEFEIRGFLSRMAKSTERELLTLPSGMVKERRFLQNGLPDGEGSYADSDGLKYEGSFLRMVNSMVRAQRHSTKLLLDIPKHGQVHKHLPSDCQK